MPDTDCRLYLITPPRIADLPAFLRALEEALAAGDVAALQVRLKDVPDAEIERVTRAVLPLAHAHEAAVILNDRPDLASKLGCDGVHVGQEDAPYAEARRVMGARAMIGVTCHDSRHLAMEAAEAGADYVAFGAMFPTTTKAAPTACELEILSIWQETMQTPCVAIGGITPENCGPVVQAGADFIAASNAVWSHPQGPGAAVTAFLAAIARAQAAERQRQAIAIGPGTSAASPG